MIRASLYLGALKESPSCKKPLTPGFKVMSEGPAEHTAAVLRCQIPLGRLSVESLSRSFPGVRSDPKRQEAQGTRKAKGEAGSEEKRKHTRRHTQRKRREQGRERREEGTPLTRLRLESSLYRIVEAFYLLFAAWHLWLPAKLHSS